MKRVILCILVLALLTTVAACDKNEPQATQPTETTPTATQPPQPTEPEEPEIAPLEVLLGNQYISEWTDDYINLASVTWQSIALGKDSAAAYPKLAKKLEDFSQEDAQWAQHQLEDMLPGAREMAKSMGSDFYGYSYETTCSVQRADSLIFSARMDYFAYTGGARPYYGTMVLNLDTETGNELPLSQVVLDLEQLPQQVSKALEKKYPDIHQATFDDIDRILKAYPEKAYVWTLDHQGITFYFGAAEIAPAAVGAMEVKLWFEDHPGLFKEDYLQAPEKGYVIGVPLNSQVDVDLKPGDGVYDQLRVSMDSEGVLTIVKNGSAITDGEFYGYGAEVYLVTADNQRFYLYVETSAENDYRTFRVFDLNGTEPRRIGVLSGEGFTGVWDEDYIVGSTWFNRVFNDPSRFALSRHMDILGTMSGTRYYCMNPDNGIPEPVSDYYTLPEDREPLVTRITVKAKLLPGMMDMEIPAGTKLWFLRSNGEDYVDMRMENGKQCRIYVTYQGWEGYVNGIPEGDCFDGILYAG